MDDMTYIAYVPAQVSDCSDSVGLAYPWRTHEQQPIQADRPMACQVGILDGYYDPGDHFLHHRYAGVYAGVIR